MKTIYGLFHLLFMLQGYPDLYAQQVHSQFYSQFSLPSGLAVNVLIQANDYAIWMAGKNYTTGRAFFLRCDYAGVLTWYNEFEGTSDQNEISSLAPAADGSCIFTYMHIDNTGIIGYGRIDSTGEIMWFRSYSGSNLNWTSSLQAMCFGNDFVLAGSRLSNFDSGTLNLIRIDENGNVLASAAFGCIPIIVKKILKDSHGNILICGDYFYQYSSRAFLARTDSNFLALSLQNYHGAVERVYDAVINSSDEVLFSGLTWEDQIGSVWSAALMKVNSSNGQVIWGKRFVSPDWLVSEFFGIEPGTDSASYFVIFEPEYFHGISYPYQTTGVLRFTENGIADTVFYRNDSTYFFMKLEKGKDKSYLQGFTNPNSSNAVIWKSNSLIGNFQQAGGLQCFSRTTFDYPLSAVTVQSAAITCNTDYLLTFLPASLQQHSGYTSQDITCNFYWVDTISAVEEPGLNADVMVIPNPCSEVFHLSSKTEIREIELTDITGRIVLSVTMNNQKQGIEVSGLPTGLYIAHLKFRDNKISIVKIQVERVTQR